MGVIWDRVAAGRKAAAKNISKRPDFYSWIAKFRGEKQSDREARVGIGDTSRETVEYRVSLRGVEEPHGRTMFFDTRSEARVYKKTLKNAGFDAFITQFHFVGNIIAGEREVR